MTTYYTQVFVVVFGLFCIELNNIDPILFSLNCFVTYKNPNNPNNNKLVYIPILKPLLTFHWILMRNLTLSIWGINRQKQKRQTKSGVFSE